MPIDLVSQLVSAAIRAFALGFGHVCGLVAVSYPIFSRSARDVDSRTRRYAPSNPFGGGGSNSPAKGAANSARSHPTASDGIGTNFRTGGANPRADEAHAHRAKGQMGVIERDAHRSVPCDFDAAVCPDDPRILGSAPNRARCQARPQPGSRHLRIGLFRGTRFGRVPPGQDSSATSLERLGRRKASSRSSA